MTTLWWTHLWFRWLLCVFLSWLGLEVASIVYAHMTGEQNVFNWTLSDTIRRWSIAARWLAPLAVGIAAGLMWHFFAEKNSVG